MNNKEISNSSRAARKYSVNDYYLDNIDTPNKAYILGILYADGYNNTIRNRIVLNLEYTDKLILEQIKNEFEYSGPLLYDKKDGIRKPQYRLSINNKRLSEKLEYWGCPKKKTEILKFPKFLDDSLIHHFIRGYFDGDGSIYFTAHGKYKYYGFSIIGTEDIVFNILEHLKNVLGLSICIQSASRRKNKTGNILIKEGRVAGKTNMINIMEYLYKDSDLKLVRKFEKYNSIKSDSTSIRIKQIRNLKEIIW